MSCHDVMMSCHVMSCQHSDSVNVQMTCFVCNLPIQSHQVGLVWQGGNGVDDILRDQVKIFTHWGKNISSILTMLLESR